jgi:pimeloyl-ACP methyl ester carboxylesterase
MKKPLTTLPPSLDAPLQRRRLPSGIEVAFYEDSGASGRPLVLLHSVNAAPSAMEVKPLFEAFRGQRPVYALDLPGFGQSQRGPMDYNPALFAETISDFLQSLPGPAPDIVALSLTAEFAARAVVAHEAPCHRLVLVSPTGVARRLPPDPARLAPISAVLSAPGVSDAFFRALTSKPSIRFFLNKAFVGETPDELVNYAWHTARATGAKFAPLSFLGMRLFTRDALKTLYAQLPCATLVLFDEDPNIDFEALPELLTANHHVTAQRIAPSLGMPHWDCPELTRQAILDFFEADAERP